MRRNHKQCTEETIQKEKKMETEENLNDIVARKINNYAVHQNIGLVDELKVKLFDQI